MNVTVGELMRAQVMTATPHQTVEHVRGVMRRNSVHALPVVNPEGEPLGIISASDLLDGHSNGTPISGIMTRKVYTINQHASPHLAARIMRNHHIHRVVVTHGQKIVGIVSSFDLLRLIEEHRFVPKNAPTETKRKGGERARTEAPSDS